MRSFKQGWRKVDLSITEKAKYKISIESSVVPFTNTHTMKTPCSQKNTSHEMLYTERESTVTVRQGVQFYSIKMLNCYITSQTAWTQNI